MPRVARPFALLLPLLLAASPAAADDFDAYLTGVQAQARDAGIAASVLHDALDGLSPDPQVLKLETKQPERSVSFAQYRRNILDAQRIARGRALMEQHRALLSRLHQQYGVRPAIMVALWGIESNYGQTPGDFNVVQALATLGYAGERTEFFTSELLAALRILDEEGRPAGDLQGSWAGAMGQCQFLPSTYREYAADGDGDGVRDIWNNEADVLASIANYLHTLGWRDGLAWGHAVTAQEARSHGWRENADTVEHTRPIIHHAGPPLYPIRVDRDAPQLYLVSDNFKVLLRWNRSRYFAAAVGMLAEKLEE